MKKTTTTLITTLLLFALPLQSFAAIAFDQSAQYSATGQPLITLPNVAATSSNNLILYMAQVNGDLNDSCVGAFANGDQMTQVPTKLHTAGVWVYLYYILGHGGTQNIFGSGCTNNQTNNIAASYTGVLQSAPLDASTTNTVSSATTITTALTTQSNNAWMVSVVNNNQAVSLSAGGGVTARQNLANYDALGDSGGPITPAGTQSMTWNGGSASWSTIQLSIAPAPVSVYASALQVESQQNPSAVATGSPRFSARFTEASSTAQAVSYQLQVSTSPTNWSTPYWDSGTKTLSSSTPSGQRTPQIYSTTTFPLDGSTYYWRMLFIDQVGNNGDWSTTTDSFTMANPTLLQDLSYTYDKAGNITSIVDLGGGGSRGTTSYQYDNLYRLASASTTGTTQAPFLQTYAYDWLGNLTQKSDQGTYSYAQTSYANPDAVTQIGTLNYTYDPAGNLLTSGNITGTSSYTWDYRGRMTDTISTLGGATTTHYTYDANDQRVQMDVRKGGATTTTKYYNQYYEVTGATTTMYIYGGGQLLATIEGSGKSTSTNLVLTDHLGSTNVTSGPTGLQTQLLTYHPYGDTRQNQQAGASTAQRKYIGQPYDDATALSYLQSRYYSGGNGKFLSQDPISRDVGMMQKMPWYILSVTGNPAAIDQTSLLSDPQLLNFYSYSENNPITKSDPTGLQSADNYAQQAKAQVIAQFRNSYMSAAETRFNQGVNALGYADAWVGVPVGIAITTRSPITTIGAVVALSGRAYSDYQKGSLSSPKQYIESEALGASAARITEGRSLFTSLVVNGSAAMIDNTFVDRTSPQGSDAAASITSTLAERGSQAIFSGSTANSTAKVATPYVGGTVNAAVGIITKSILK